VRELLQISGPIGAGRVNCGSVFSQTKWTRLKGPSTGTSDSGEALEVSEESDGKLRVRAKFYDLYGGLYSGIAWEW